MKLIIFAALAASMSYAQTNANANAKAEAPKSQERFLTDAESFGTRLDSQKIQLKREEFKISKFEEEIKEFQQHYSQIVIDACKSVGVSMDKIQTECQFTNGYDPVTDKPLVDQNGKPVSAHVAKVTPPTTVAPTTPTTPTGTK